MEERSQGRVPNPCTKDCPKRTAVCHGECKEYADYAAYRRMIYKSRLMDGEVNALESESYRKGRRRMHLE